MELNLSWTSPIPTPTCGFRIKYARNGDPGYFPEVDASGTTATIPIDDHVNYYGEIVSDCCAGNDSIAQKFGINSYGSVRILGFLPVNLGANVQIELQYLNPYALTISFSAQITTSGGVTTTKYFNVDFPASTTLATIFCADASLRISDTAVLNNDMVIIKQTSYSGELIHYDALNTPLDYGLYKYGDTSGTIWTSGSPLILPSFLLNGFTVTDIDTSGNIVGGLLSFSYIVQTPYYSTGLYTFNVYDETDSVLIGTIDIAAGGLRGRISSAITMNDTYDIPSNNYIMKVLNPDGVILTTKQFSVPYP